MIPAAPRPAPRARLLCAVAACLLGGLVAAPAATAASSWSISNDINGRGALIEFGFGQPGDVFLAGDWNGDGIDTPGVFRPNGAVWILSDSTTGAGPLITFSWGNTGDLPLVGDWDSVKGDTVGLLRPDPAGGPNTVFLGTALRVNGGSPAGFTYGNLGDRPISGDWDASGTDTIGVYRPAGADGPPDFIEISQNATLPATTTTLPFGDLGDVPFTGDWNGDGSDTPGVFRGLGSAGRWGMKVNNVRGDGSADGFGFGISTDTPVVGDWDGNGTDTPGLVRPAVDFVPTASGGTPGVPAAPGTPNGQNASRDARVTIAYKGTKARSRRLGFTSRPTITGRLTDAAGAAIGGATVVVRARRRQFRAPTSPVDTVTTSADGSFSYKLLSGPARTITLAYTAFTGDTTPAATSAALRTIVPASLTAKVTPRSPRAGARLRVAGKLRYLPRANVQVTIQARDGKVWRTVGTVKTKAGGSYSWPYRFKGSARGRTFAFRAHVDSPVYPFTPGNSKKLSVRVR